MSAGLPSPPPLTVAAFLTSWLEYVVKPGGRARTYETYEGVCRRHLIPTLGRHRLDQLTAQHIQAMLTQKRTEELKGSSLVQIRAICASPWRRRSGGIWCRATWRRSPTRPGRRPSKPARRRQPRSASSAPTSPAIATRRSTSSPSCSACGRARSWASAGATSTWPRARSASPGNSSGRPTDHGSHYSSRPRRCAAGASYLFRWTCWTPCDATGPISSRKSLLARPAWRPDLDLVFCSPTGTPLDESSLTQRFQVALTSAGLEQRRFHDLRHTTGSFLTARGVHPRLIMEVLGHSQISTTMNTYAHGELDSLRGALAHVSELPPSGGQVSQPTTVSRRFAAGFAAMAIRASGDPALGGPEKSGRVGHPGSSRTGPRALARRRRSWTVAPPGSSAPPAPRRPGRRRRAGSRGH